MTNVFPMPGHYDARERATATPPAPTFDRYERDIHHRTPPPGIPYGYILEVCTCVCNTCGRKQQTSRLFAVQRAGYGSAVLGMGISSPVYDRPIKRVDKTEGTPVCLWCIEDLRPEPVEYPVPGAAVGRSARMAAADGATPSRPRAVPTAPADVADDFT